MRSYRFQQPLSEGVILSRPNRFLFQVCLEGKEVLCHCPSTGSIGSFRFENIPCLLSKSHNPNRKTAYTVEAISLDPVHQEGKSWIGINQTKVNSYIEHFLKTGQINKIFSNVDSIEKEIRLHDSRIDFLINARDYLEIKTPLKNLPSHKHPLFIERNINFFGLDRLIKHFNDLSNRINGDSRAILVLCYLYEADPFRVPSVGNADVRITQASQKARFSGLESWQVNLKINEIEIILLDHFPLQL